MSATETNQVTTAEAPVSRISELSKHDGQIVTIQGWLYNLRESGKLLFPIFRDGSGVVQGVVPKAAVSPETFETIKTLTLESSVIVRGKVRADKRAPGGFELDVTDIQVVQKVAEDDPYPISLQGAWRRLPDGASPSLDSLAQAERDPAHSRRDHQGSARFLRQSGIHAHRSANLDAGRLRRHHHAVPSRLLRRAGLPRRSPDSSISKRQQWRWARSTRSVRRFARKNQRRAATSPSSGWSSRKSPSDN